MDAYVALFSSWYKGRKTRFLEELRVLENRRVDFVYIFMKLAGVCKISYC